MDMPNELYNNMQILGFICTSFFLHMHIPKTYAHRDISLSGDVVSICIRHCISHKTYA